MIELLLVEFLCLLLRCLMMASCLKIDVGIFIDKDDFVVKLLGVNDIGVLSFLIVVV